jgi:hypothetical protein
MATTTQEQTRSATSWALGRRASSTMALAVHGAPGMDYVCSTHAVLQVRTPVRWQGTVSTTGGDRQVFKSEAFCMLLP